MQSMDQSTSRNFKGIWIPKEIWLSKSLSLQEKVMLVEIDSLCTSRERGCWASNAHFAEFMNLSKPRITALISSLSEKGLISVSMKREGARVIERNIFITNKFRNGGQFTDYCGQFTEFGGQDADGGWSGSNEYRYTLNNTIEIKDSCRSATQKDDCDVIKVDDELVIKCWNDIAKEKEFKGCRIITSAAAKNIKAIYALHCKIRRKAGKPSDEVTTFVCRYLERGFKSWVTPFHSGQRGWKADLEYATRKTTFEKVFSEAE